ncbi:MAG: DUF4190 domain-containing protein [Acidobacteriota bacterium]
MSQASNEIMKAVLPVGRSAWAIAAGYLAFFAIFLIPAPIALLCGLMALRDLRQRPAVGGRGRAWFAIISGGFFTLFGLFVGGVLLFAPAA